MDKLSDRDYIEKAVNTGVRVGGELAAEIPKRLDEIYPDDPIAKTLAAMMAMNVFVLKLGILKRTNPLLAQLNELLDPERFLESMKDGM